MATASAQLDATRRRAQEVGGDLRERFEHLEPVVRERWGDLEPVLRDRWSEIEPVMRERWSEVEPVVRERWEELEPVVRQRLDELEPVMRQAELGLWRALRALFTGLAVLPATLVRVLKAVAGAADEATERGQQLSEEAMKRRRRRRGVTMRRRTLVAYVAGGVGVGFVIGWALGRQQSGEEPDPDEVPYEVGGPMVDPVPGGSAPPVE